MSENYDRIGREILLAVRNELYMNFPYMDVPLCALEFLPSAAASADAEGAPLGGLTVAWQEVGEHG